MSKLNPRPLEDRVRARSVGTWCLKSTYLSAIWSTITVQVCGNLTFLLLYLSTLKKNQDESRNKSFQSLLNRNQVSVGEIESILSRPRPCRVLLRIFREDSRRTFSEPIHYKFYCGNCKKGFRKGKQLEKDDVEGSSECLCKIVVIRSDLGRVTQNHKMIPEPRNVECRVPCSTLG